MRFEKVITSENDEFSKLISCDFDNDTLLKKINIEPDDETFFYLNKNQYALLIEKQEIYAIADEEGNYRIDFSKKVTEADKKKLQSWKNYKDEKNKNLPLSLVFINLNEIVDCKFIFNKPIEYIDYTKSNVDSNLNVNIPYKSMFVGDGLYDFKIVNTYNFLSSTLGIRDVYTKQELIERVRKDIKLLIEYDLKKSDEEYNIPIKIIKSKKNNISISADSNIFDKKLEKYGIKITRFSIERFDEYKSKKEIKKNITKLTNSNLYRKISKNNIGLFDFNHIKIDFDTDDELIISQLGLKCNLCGFELEKDVNYCLNCGTKINKNIS